MRPTRYLVGIEPDLARLGGLRGLEVLEVLRQAITAVLVELPDSQVPTARAAFGGVVHVYETEEQARRAWRVLCP